MGYTTDFYGKFETDRPLSQEHRAYLEQFAATRRMKRDEAKVALLKDELREAVGLPVGEDGEFFVGGEGFMGSDRSDDVVNYNIPPGDQPSLWCQWVPSEDGEGIEWNEAEKFYMYVEWLEYLIEKFLDPWGYKLNGQVSYQGGEVDDRGIIYCKDNVVACVEDKITNENPFE